MLGSNGSRPGSLPAEESQADDQAESRMRQSLERLGGSRPIERSNSVLANRPRRHAFVQDGQVVVEQARRRQRIEPANPLASTPEPVTTPDTGSVLIGRVERAERLMREAKDAAKALETRLGHLQLEFDDTTRRLQEREATILQLRQDEAQACRVREELRAELEALRRQPLREARPPAAEQDEGVEPEPVQWWLPTSTRDTRPRRG